MVRLEQGHLIPHARFVLTQGVDPAPDRRDALADVEVEPFHKGRIDAPAPSCQDLFDSQPGAEHYAVCDTHDASAPVPLDNLGVEQRGKRHPTRLWSWPFRLATLGLHPMAKMGQERRRVILEAIGQKEWYTAWR